MDETPPPVLLPTGGGDPFDGSRPYHVAIELERIRLAVEVGFSDTRGRLNLLQQKMQANIDDTESLDQRITDLERKVWSGSAVAAVLGAAVGIAAPILFK